MIETWLLFWVAALICSTLLFLGVALFVGIKGWSDLKELRRQFAAKPTEKSQDENSAL